MIGDTVRWKGANGVLRGTVETANRTWARVLMDNGKYMVLRNTYIKFHNKDYHYDGEQ